MKFLNAVRIFLWACCAAGAIHAGALAQETTGAISVQEVTQETLIPLESMCVKGVIVGGDRPLAIINGESFGVGDSVAGATVVSVDAGGVVFGLEGKQYYNGIAQGCEPVVSLSAPVPSSVEDTLGKLRALFRVPASDDTRMLGASMLLVFGILAVFSVVMYVYTALCLQIIAYKTHTACAWFAWFPVLNMFLVCMIARKPFWWILLLFVPLASVIVVAMLFMAMSRVRHKPAWVGILILVPVVNLVVPAYLAAGPQTDTVVASGPESSKSSPKEETGGPATDMPPVYRP